MKKIISLCLIAIFLLSAIPAMAAESGTCGEGISWSFDGGVLTISGEGKMADMSGSAPWESYKDSITGVVFTGGVTYVGAGAFKNCKNLTSVNFGSAMYELGAEAFQDCDGLTSLSMPASFKVFGAGSLQSCNNLKRIDCAGRFPSFRENCLWDTHTAIYYPAERPWPVDTINQLESAFHGRVQFLGSDGTDPNAQPETTAPPPETTAPPTEATTVPTETTSSTEPSITLPGITTPLFTAPNRVTQPTEMPVQLQDDDNTTLWLALLLLLSVSAAAAALVIHNQQVKRRRKQRRRRKPQ